MKVRVVDRRGWGRGGPAVVVRALEIDATCPRCGGPRGEPRPHTFHEDGEWFVVDRWANPCGHIDFYDALLTTPTEGSR